MRPAPQLPTDVQHGLADATAGRVHALTADDLTPATGAALADRNTGSPLLRVTDTWVHGWWGVPESARKATLATMASIVARRWHPALTITPLGAGGVLAVGAPFDVELTFHVDPEAEVTWLSVAA